MNERPIVKSSIWRGMAWALPPALAIYRLVIWLGVTLWSTFANLHYLRPRGVDRDRHVHHGRQDDKLLARYRTEHTMNDNEAIQMMKRASAEIKDLRRQIDRLAPKAHAYDNLSAVLRLLPQPSQGYGEDVAFLLDRRIEEIMKAEVKTR